MVYDRLLIFNTNLSSIKFLIGTRLFILYLFDLKSGIWWIPQNQMLIINRNLLCRWLQLHIVRSRASSRAGPRNINTTSPSSKPSPTKSGTSPNTQVHGRVQSPSTSKASPSGHHPRLLHLCQPWSSTHHLPVRKRFTHSHSQQDHPSARNWGTHLVTCRNGLTTHSPKSC